LSATTTAATTRKREIRVNKDSKYGWGIGIFRRSEVGVYYNGRRSGSYIGYPAVLGEVRKMDVRFGGGVVIGDIIISSLKSKRLCDVNFSVFPMHMGVVLSWAESSVLFCYQYSANPEMHNTQQSQKRSSIQCIIQITKVRNYP
jgi:hypothetical protein